MTKEENASENEGEKGGITSLALASLQVEGSG
jgi:hypothetical protein